jgi:hypothetical protein
VEPAAIEALLSQSDTDAAASLISVSEGMRNPAISQCTATGILETVPRPG